MAVTISFLMGCAVLLVVGCAGVRSEAPQKQEEQARSDRCEGTRTFKDKVWGYLFTTNDVPGCAKGGLLSGTDNDDRLHGKYGDDEIRGLGATDFINGGGGNDVIYGGPGADLMGGDEGDDVLYGGDSNDRTIDGGAGEDVLYGGKGKDEVEGDDRLVPGRGFVPGLPLMRDELYCGPGKEDLYSADRLDYVDSSCEKKGELGGGIA
jgi:Ca2+-binding RTX toxin-like protein